ncbi:hypothetical protein DIS24_g9700 [Lasiodiplodia hormozganensis]|uniref:Uncharacterized protein n=1 Tax=Lasiodiplodia hormozganensis TaxID=869390 RepID=A0AA39XW10_9PEZI|nr:hypothetical protein DIS24_g9700 [Lasiodiplodia hormozganensis]
MSALCDDDRSSIASDVEDDWGSHPGEDEIKDRWTSYELAMEGMHQATRELTNCIRFRDPDNPATRPRVHPHARRSDDGMTQDRLDRFDDAIARLPRLRTFLHEPLFTAANGWRTTWQGQRFSYKILIEGGAYQRRSEEGVGQVWRSGRPTIAQTEDNLEALHLSLTLRALGLRAAAASSTSAGDSITVPIQHLRIDVRNIGFWSKTNFACLWDWGRVREQMYLLGHEDPSHGYPHTWTRWMGGPEDEEAAKQKEHFGKELKTIGRAFSELRELEMNVRSLREAAVVAKGACRFLLRCGRLERLRLVFAEEVYRCRLNDWIARRVFDKVAQAPGCWPKLRRLELVGFVAPMQSLLEMLKAQEPTLRHLVLADCRLKPNGGCWEDVFKGLATHLRLEVVHFSMLEEGTEWTVIMDSSDLAWTACHDGKTSYALHETAVYDYVLRRSATLPPLDPKTFLEHQQT